MSDLVWMHHNEPMTTSEAIAEGTGVQHKNVLELVRKFTSELLELCPVHRTGSVRGRSPAILLLRPPGYWSFHFTNASKA